VRVAGAGQSAGLLNRRDDLQSPKPGRVQDGHAPALPTSEAWREKSLATWSSDGMAYAA
jgi:hypothetical protein